MSQFVFYMLVIGLGLAGLAIWFTHYRGVSWIFGFFAFVFFGLSAAGATVMLARGMA